MMTVNWMLNSSPNSSPSLPLSQVGWTGLSRTGLTVVAVCLGIIMVLGFLNNLLVLVLFCKYKVLRSPMNMLLLNISVSDMLVCICGTPFSFAASVQGRWLVGEQGCKWYGFANSLFGIVSLLSLCFVSYDRSYMITRIRTTHNFKRPILAIGVSWLYSLLWTVPPLFGWSAYGPEGQGISCSVNWKTHTMNGMSYIICLFIFCLALPILFIVCSYARILYTIKQVGQNKKTAACRRKYHVFFMVLITIVCFLLCWMPYGIMALLATFGDSDLITSTVSIVPVVLAKTSTVYNPIIYVLMNKQTFQCYKALYQM
ncbi:pinopsin-like [Callorhinchus milii]|uniref:pinopsin-like n=1 Tax=Callorhinchus milii TaxID=7868 RepID=UPI00045757C2|nr:pinopsin-like [Callorhinchus milii]|eukprot:gi/632940023/ref/XP_007883991.1/ PREDICTED: pinopsin-like [Callorhinchus milii]